MSHPQGTETSTVNPDILARAGGRRPAEQRWEEARWTRGTRKPRSRACIFPKRCSKRSRPKRCDSNGRFPGSCSEHGSAPATRSKKRPQGDEDEVLIISP